MTIFRKKEYIGVLLERPCLTMGLAKVRVCWCSFVTDKPTYWQGTDVESDSARDGAMSAHRLYGRDRPARRPRNDQANPVHRRIDRLIDAEADAPVLFPKVELELGAANSASDAEIEAVCWALKILCPMSMVLKQAGSVLEQIFTIDCRSAAA
jgi:putative redox protein